MSSKREEKVEIGKEKKKKKRNISEYSFSVRVVENETYT